VKFPSRFPLCSPSSFVPPPIAEEVMASTSWMLWSDFDMLRLKFSGCYWRKALAGLWRCCAIHTYRTKVRILEIRASRGMRKCLFGETWSNDSSAGDEFVRCRSRPRRFLPVPVHVVLRCSVAVGDLSALPEPYKSEFYPLGSRVP
jgi:hypothetical protein